MFLEKVYRYNKWLFAGMLFFIAMQLFVFYRRGMVFSPWYNYGMYSAVIKPQKQYAVYKVYADGKLLRGDNFSPQQWDAFHFVLEQADAASCNEHFYDTQVKRLFTKFHLPVPGKENFINTLFDDAEIRALYPPHLAKKLHAKKITFVPMLYEWNGNTLVEKDSLTQIESSSFQCK
jgi:hypothetical protein